MSKFRLLATVLLVALCTGFYSCGGDDEDITITSNEGGNGSITGTTAKVDLKKAGSLSTLISDDVKFNITDLTITGDINGDDIALIREMAGADINGDETKGRLSVLNLKDANIVAGGNPYYVSSSIYAYYSRKNTISAYMFVKCNNLTSIVFPKDIEIIEELIFCYYDSDNYTYKGNPNLTSIILGNKVTSIQSNAFAYSGIESIDLPSSLIEIRDGVFSGCEKLTSINIPNNVTEIGSYAFSGCKKLSSVNIPSGVISLHSTFKDCIELTYITIPNSVESIGGEVFTNCSKLEKIEIGSKAKIEGFIDGIMTEDNDLPPVGPFTNCFNLKEFMVSENNPNCVVADGGLYSKDMTRLIDYPNAKQTTSFIIPDGVTQIGARYSWMDFSHEGTLTPFYCNQFIKSLIIPSSVRRIYCSFIGCINLNEVHIHSAVPPILGKYGIKMSFIGMTDRTRTLYVPKGALVAYSESDWKYVFNNIVEE